MTEIFVQLVRLSDLEPIGIWRSKDKEIVDFPDIIKPWFAEYCNSDEYEHKGEDGFEEYVAKIGYKIERVFLVNLYMPE